jgi:phosphate transport system substrate-binding protein
MTQRIFRAARVLLATAGLAAAATAPAVAADITLTETGSTLLQPLFDIMVPDYLKSHPGVEIKTAATNSEAGQKHALSGQVLIGASDAYMSDAQIRANPNFLNIPVAISAQTINYNLPGLNTPNLRLDGPAIAGIYTGAIRQWDSPAIAALNPGVAPRGPRSRARPAAARGRQASFNSEWDIPQSSKMTVSKRAHKSSASQISRSLKL